MHIGSRTTFASERVGAPARWLDGALVQFCDRVWLWRERAAQRKVRGGFDGRALQDIAVDRATAHAEAAKPFWRT